MICIACSYASKHNVRGQPTDRQSRLALNADVVQSYNHDQEHVQEEHERVTGREEDFDHDTRVNTQSNVSSLAAASNILISTRPMSPPSPSISTSPASIAISTTSTTITAPSLYIHSIHSLSQSKSAREPHVELGEPEFRECKGMTDC